MSKLLIIESNHENIETEISGEKALREFLINLVRKESRIIILNISDIGIFTIGVGLPFGFVQFSKDGNPPYLVALANGNPLGTDSKETIEFDAGGTPTPIPTRQCIPYNLVVDIVTYYFNNQEIPESIKWEEI